MVPFKASILGRLFLALSGIRKSIVDLLLSWRAKMSRNYQMDVSIKLLDTERKEKVIDAARDEWPFEEFWHDEDEHMLSSSGADFLYGGESEEDFSVRLAAAIWKANRGYCEVIVRATCLEDLPYDGYLLDETAYEDWLRRAREEREKLCGLGEKS